MSELTAEDVLEQDVPVGGAVDGHLAPAAVAVLPQGVVTIREVPAMDATTGKMVIPSGTVQRLGRNALRRRLTLSVRSGTATAYAVIGDTEQQARSGYGFEADAGKVLPPLLLAGELWFAAVGGDLSVSYIAEIDA